MKKKGMACIMVFKVASINTTLLLHLVNSCCCQGSWWMERKDFSLVNQSYCRWVICWPVNALSLGRLFTPIINLVAEKLGRRLHGNCWCNVIADVFVIGILSPINVFGSFFKSGTLLKTSFSTDLLRHDFTSPRLVTLFLTHSYTLWMMRLSTYWPIVTAAPRG